ncbi:MAG TPA: hypothetical protein VFF91_04635 [Pseudoxanthomonas sp.]|nr:hypothetical protein [Pseudoxanthomonas sp.]
MSKIAKWKRWIEPICDDCGNVMLSRDMFLDLHGMIQKNPKMQQSGYFHECMRDTYIAHTAMMLRKHAKIDKDSISLAGLARDILENRDKVKGLSVGDDFESITDRFTQCVKKVEAFADRVIAHRDRRAPSHMPTYSEVDEAIDAMDRLSIQCSLAIGADYCDTCKPTVQYGWLLIFREMGIET